MRKIDDERTLLELKEALNKGDLSVRDILIKHYKPAAERIAESYFGLGLEKDDVISSAYEGLVIGVNKLDESKNNNITDHIYDNITKAIKLNILSYYGISYILDNEESKEELYTRVIEILKAKKELRRSLHRNPNFSEIANYIGKKRITKEVYDLIDFKLSTEFNRISEKEVEEKLNASLNPEGNLINKENSEELIRLILQEMSENQKKVFYLYFIECMSLPKIARIMNVSYHRIEQLRDAVITKIINNQEIIEFLKSDEKYYSIVRKLELQSQLELEKQN